MINNALFCLDSVYSLLWHQCMHEPCVFVCVHVKECVQGRHEVTAGRCLSASLGSLSTDYGDGSRKRLAREGE